MMLCVCFLLVVDDEGADGGAGGICGSCQGDLHEGGKSQVKVIVWGSCCVCIIIVDGCLRFCCIIMTSPCLLLPHPTQRKAGKVKSPSLSVSI